MNRGDAVVLTCAPWSGVIDKVHGNGRVDIALDDGGRAWGMSQDEVRKVDEDDAREALHEDGQGVESPKDERRATGDKAWPPSGMETKVPNQSGQK